MKYTTYNEGSTFFFFNALFMRWISWFYSWWTSSYVGWEHLTLQIKNSWLEFKTTSFTPRAIVPLMINGDRVTGRIITQLWISFWFYCSYLCLELGSPRLWVYDLLTSFGAVATSLGNVGPWNRLSRRWITFGFLSPGGQIFLFLHYASWKTGIIHDS